MQPGFSGTIRNQNIGSIDVKGGLIAQAGAGPSEIMFEMNALNDAVNMLHVEIDQIDKALLPLVLPLDRGEGGNGTSQPEPCRSPIGQAIHDRCLSVRAAIERIAVLRNSLAL